MATLFAPLKILIVYVNLPTPKPHYSHVKMSWYLVQSWIQCNFRLFWPKCRYHGNSLSSLEDSDIIFWFVDPENLLFARKMSRYLVEISAILFFWPKFGCHGNRPCFPDNSDSIFEFADLKNPTVQAKNVLTSCAELKSVHFWLIFALIWLPWQLPLLSWKCW